MDSEIASCKQFFSSHHIILSEEWLESCIEWYREENPNSNYSRETLHQKVYEQWLLLDLRETEVAILPPNLNATDKTVLTGIYALQMQYVIDISQPKLLQLQKIRNTIVNATDEEYQTNTSNKRMLQLTLTDGVQEVEAIEYKPISVLDLNLTPGIKIKISGPVTVRRGQIMLESKNVEILGGEVEELLITNAVENILAKELNLPLNSNPTVKLEASTTNTKPETKAASNTVANQYIYLNNDIKSSSNIYKRPETVCNKFLQTNITTFINRPNTKQHTTISSQAGTTPIQRNPFYDSEQMIIDECDNIFEIEKDFEMEQKQNNFVCTTIKSTNNPLNHFADENDTDVFDGIDLESHLDIIDQQIANNLKVTPISDLVAQNITNEKFRINGKFQRVSGKLNLDKFQKWSLRIVVGDDSGEIETWVDSDVITQIIDCAPSAVLAMKADIKNKNPGASNFMMQKIHDLRSKIEQLNCVMEITFKSSEEYPTITSIK